MITYKGDIFVKGKTFLYEDNIIRFLTKTKKGFMFESINKKEDNKMICLSESDARSLKEVHLKHEKK